MARRGVERSSYLSLLALVLTTMLVVVACGRTASTTRSHASPTPSEISPTATPEPRVTEPTATPWLYDPNASSAPPPPTEVPTPAAPTTLPENITFSGKLTGTMNQAVNPHADENSDPGSFANPQGATHQPTWTRCSTYKGAPDSLGNSASLWEADIVGDVGGSQVALAIAMDRGQFHLPGSISTRSLNDPLSNIAVLVFGPNGAQWYSRKGQYDDAQITVNSDMHSGQVSIAIADVPYGHDDHVERISGEWRCG